MFAIAKTDEEHPDEVAARARLRDVACGPLQEALAVWCAVIRRLGRDNGNDEYYDGVTSLILDLQERLTYGRVTRQDELKAIATGELVPMFDVAGNPVVQGGEQMYSAPAHAKLIAAAIAATVLWLERDTAGLTAREYLCGAHPWFHPEVVDYIVHEAEKLRRGADRHREGGEDPR